MKTRVIMSVLLVAILLIGFSACDDDDKEPVGQPLHLLHREPPAVCSVALVDHRVPPEVLDLESLL